MMLNGNKASLKDIPWPMVLVLLKQRIVDRLLVTFWSCYYRCYLIFCGCSCGRGLRVDGRTWLLMRQKGMIRLGSRVTLISRFGSNLVGLTNPTVLDCRRGGRIEMGDGSGCSSAILSSCSSIKIGRHVKIGGNVRIYDHDFHSLNYEVRRGGEDQLNIKTEPIVIGDDVFIGVNAIIMKGVTIGNRAIIGAGSVITRNIANDEVWAGNPARLIRPSQGRGELE